MIRFHAMDEEAPVIERALGTQVWDVEGKEYLDLVSGQVCATIGHNHPRIVAAVLDACKKEIHCNDFLLSDDAIDLAEALIGMLPEPLSKCVFKSTGSEANEVAFYMAKIKTGNYEIVSPDRSFYGNTAAARAATFRTSHRNHGPNLNGTFAIPAPYCYRCPLSLTPDTCSFACADVGFAMYDRQTAGSPAAVISEPILSGGGVIDPPRGYFKHLKALADERGMLFILDEAQTGLGRTGTMFAFQHENVDVIPDILTLSKTLGGGIPLSATVTTDEIERSCFEDKFIMGSSHTNDPLPTRVGKAVLDVLREDDLPRESKVKGEYFKGRLLLLMDKFELIGDVRGRGLLLGVEFVQDRGTKVPAYEEGNVFVKACTDLGMIVNVIQTRDENTVLRIAPPLVIEYAQIDQALEIIEKALELASVSRD